MLFHVHRPRTPVWLFWLFQAACAYILILELASIPLVLVMREELQQTVPGGYGARLFMRPFVIGGSLLLGWIRFFWPEREGARAFAMIGGALLMVFSIVIWLNASVNDMPVSPWVWLGYPLAALVFFAYSAGGRERRL